MATSREELVKWRMMAGADGFLGVAVLPSAIEAYLEVPPPKGDPDELRAMAGTYQSIGKDADGAQVEVDNLAKSKLPEVWVGQARERASEVITAVARELDQSVTVMGKARGELDMLADGIQDAQDTHSSGQDALHQAKNEVAGDIQRARAIALTGMDQVIAGFDRAKDSQECAARVFTDLAAQARASQLDSEHLDAADRLVLGQSAVPGGPHDVNIIMSANDAERASERLDELSAGDRERFDAMLDAAKSPQEKAYLMRALAAGHSMDDIERFGEQIHPYGDDPEWLRNHLQPTYNQTDETTGDTVPVSYDGAPWEQTGGTCVAASTVTARAMVDPLYAFELTTGGNPGDEESTSPDAFEQRFLDETERVYGRPIDDDGLSKEQGVEAANNELGPATGGEYEFRDLNTPEEREAVFNDVAESVDEGRPVPIQVEGFDDEGNRSGHQMMIIGHENGMLQIYNPWGHTVWVSEDDFVNGHMEGASDDRLPTVDGVHLPT
ncbi:MAG: peptidoglycan-binding protein [Actinophytocola sp.]|uniref:hypothetical protein n=1 Tax=Actinophytocola sp. TaxID=1872138 RepID=UPI001320D652|nr:hypothetical protein [Actinophytocola sp.]MPZ81946.1 peptidoglycan-binding protein [Actinophytocola sp.]